jgi:hypothetical protein
LITITATGGAELTRNVYAGGSAATGSVQTPSTAASLDNAVPSIYRNCTIAWNPATWSVSLTADFDYNVNGEASAAAIADGYVNQKWVSGRWPASSGSRWRLGASRGKAVSADVRLANVNPSEWPGSPPQ